MQAFIEMAHRIVWCTVATVDPAGRPRSRILHPLWVWEEGKVVGWVCTGPSSVKARHLAANPFVSCNYWDPTHDTCTAECRASWGSLEDRVRVWELFEKAPPPVGFSPKIVPGWDSPAAPAFGVLRLEPWRLRVFPGEVLLGKKPKSEVLSWTATPEPG